MNPRKLLEKIFDHYEDELKNYEDFNSFITFYKQYFIWLKDRRRLIIENETKKIFINCLYAQIKNKTKLFLDSLDDTLNHWTIKELEEYCQKSHIKYSLKCKKKKIIQKIVRLKPKIRPRNPTLMTLLQYSNFPDPFLPDEFKTEFYLEHQRKFDIKKVSKELAENDAEYYYYLETKLLLKIRKPHVTCQNLIFLLKRTHHNSIFDYTHHGGGLKSYEVSWILEINYNPQFNKKISKIQEIIGIEKYKHLNKLYIRGHNILVLKEFPELPHLKKLDLSHNKIEEIKGFDKLNDLKVLDLSYNNILEISGLNNLRKLKKLNLKKNHISMLKGLENLDSLEYINLMLNPISDWLREGLGSSELSFRNVKEIVNYCKTLTQNEVSETQESLSVTQEDKFVQIIIPEKMRKEKIKLPSEKNIVSNYFDKIKKIIEIKASIKEYNDSKDILKRLRYYGEYFVFSKILPHELKVIYPFADFEFNVHGYDLIKDSYKLATVVWNNLYGESGEDHDLQLILNNKIINIEVKASLDDNFEFLLSLLELNRARQERENYIIYFIPNIRNNKKEYYRFKNFYQDFKKGLFNKKSTEYSFKNLISN